MILSEARLETYRRASCSEEEAIARYFWNLYLAGSLLPVASLAEIVLRNQVVKAFDAAEPNWLTPQWVGWSDYKMKPQQGKSVRENPEQEILNTALRKWGSKRDPMIADIPLGFWTGLFKGHYKPYIWAKKGVLTAVFPDLTLKSPDIISEMSRRLWRFRHLRNRICHHEPIFNWPGSQKMDHQDLFSAYQETLELLSWLSQQSLQNIRRFDNFPEVWQSGWQAFL